MRFFDITIIANAKQFVFLGLVVSEPENEIGKDYALCDTNDVTNSMHYILE